jgi:hypothetical protein
VAITRERSFLFKLLGSRRPRTRTKGGQTEILVRWSAAQQIPEIIVDQRAGKNSKLPKLSFCYSAVLNFGLFLKIFQREEIIK